MQEEQLAGPFWAYKEEKTKQNKYLKANTLIPSIVPFLYEFEERTYRVDG